MKKLKTKIGLTMFMIFFISAIIPRFIFTVIFGDDFESSIAGGPFLAGGITALILALILFTLMINHIIIKRINRIALLTKDVKEGTFETMIVDDSEDEIGQLTQSFNLMVESLKRNEYLSRNFIQNFSHEFKTPLSIIQGYVELLENDTLSDKDKKDYLNQIASETKKLASMSKNILKLSQLDNALSIQKEPVDIESTLQMILQSLQYNWEKKNLTLSLNLESLFIETDAELIYQALYNVIDNAIKYADVNSTLIIEIITTVNPLVKITNQGETIPLEDQDKIFNLFYVVNKNEQVDSTGIGLTLTKKICDLLNYKISFESQNHSTTFTLTF